MVEMQRCSRGRIAPMGGSCCCYGCPLPPRPHISCSQASGPYIWSLSSRKVTLLPSKGNGLEPYSQILYTRTEKDRCSFVVFTQSQRVQTASSNGPRKLCQLSVYDRLPRKEYSAPANTKHPVHTSDSLLVFSKWHGPRPPKIIPLCCVLAKVLRLQCFFSPHGHFVRSSFRVYSI